jgi:hypothetical protein
MTATYPIDVLDQGARGVTLDGKDVTPLSRPQEV